MKKKILFMILFMKMGGVEKALLNILTLIDEDKYDVTLLLMDDQKDYLHLVPSWVKIRRATIPFEEFLLLSKGSIFSVIQALKHGNILRLIKIVYKGWVTFRCKRGWTQSAAYFSLIADKIPSLDETYDVAIDFHGPSAFTTFYIAEKISAKKKVAWIHGWMHTNFEKEYEYSDPRLCRNYYEKYDYIFGVSQKCVDEFISLLPECKDKTHLFYNIVSGDLIKHMANQGCGFIDKFDGVRILTIGRIETEKGYDIAVPVLAKLKKSGYKIKWYVIGEGTEHNNLIKLINKYNLVNDFILLGIKENPYPYIMECDIYVQPSRFEGYSTTTNEARILSKPVVTTDVSGAREQFIDGETGLIVEFGEERIYNAIKCLLDDNELRQQFSNNLSKKRVDTTKEIQKLYDIIDAT